MTRLFSTALIAAFVTLAGDADNAQPKDPPKNFTNSIGMKFVWIPPGNFMMGSPKEEQGRRDAETQHKVTLTKGFYIGVYTVTQEQWKEVIGNNPSKFNGKINLPVEQVSWDDCQEFVKKLRDKDTKAYRLPTEAEWERASRGGQEGGLYPWGDEPPQERPEYRDRWGGAVLAPLPVGRGTPNPFGVYDLCENVHEWCADWFNADYYAQSPQQNPAGPAEGERRASRGGSWRHHIKVSRVAARSSIPPAFQYADYGFRVVRCSGGL